MNKKIISCSEAQKKLKKVHEVQMQLIRMLEKVHAAHNVPEMEYDFLREDTRALRLELKTLITELSCEVIPYQQQILELQQKFEQRAEHFGVSAPLLDIPRIEGLTKKHLNVLAEIFGENNLVPQVMPSPQDLTDEYFEMMYPKHPIARDVDAGLISYRPEWWDQSKDLLGLGVNEGNNKDAYMRSFRFQAESLQGSLILTESILKPKFHCEYYGSLDGRDPSLDILMVDFSKLLLCEKNRFDMMYNEIEGSFLPYLQKKIMDEFLKKKLSIPPFEVIITPALCSNMFATFVDPRYSCNSTFEWTSTKLLLADGSDSGRIITVGNWNSGGAGFVHSLHRMIHMTSTGFRISIVFKNA